MRVRVYPQINTDFRRLMERAIVAGWQMPDRLMIQTMPNRITAVESRGGHVLHIRFRDGAEFDLDLLPYLQEWAGNSLVDPLLSPEEFQKVGLDYGTLVFSTGFDICPDVLRLWSENGRVISKEETDAYFCNPPPNVAAA